MPSCKWVRATLSGCGWVRPRLTGLLLGELPGWQLRLVATHVGKCPACAAELEALQETVAAVLVSETEPAAAPEPLPPLTPEEQARVRALVRGGRLRPARVVWALSGAAALVVSGLAVRTRLLPAPTLGRVVQASGKPEYYTWGRGWRSLPAEAEVTEGAQVRTGEADRLEVQFTDGTRARLDFGTEVRIGSRPGGKAGVPRADLELRRGRVWLLVTHDQKGLRVRTEAGTAEALGTIFTVETQGTGKGPYAEAAVDVLRGEVLVSNAHGEVKARAGTRTEARANEAPQSIRAPQQLSLRRECPWGRTQVEVWVIPPLDRGEAARRMAGRHGWIGVELALASVTLAGKPLPGPGFTVARVAAKSPAARAGIVAGDRLVAVGETPLKTRGDLWRAELLSVPGATVEVQVHRDAATMRVPVTCQDLPEVGPPASDAQLEAANREFAQGRIEEAQWQYEALASAGSAAARHNLGVLAEMAGRNEEAARSYRQAAAGAPKSARLAFSLGMALARVGNRPEAVAAWGSALARDPHLAGARYLLGRTMAFDGNDAGAQKEARRLQADPETRAQGLCLKGELARLQGDVEGALPWYQQAAAADRLYPDPPTYLGAAYYTLGRYEEARAWSQRALDIDPDSVRAWVRLGLIETDEGNLQKAEADFVRAQTAHPEYATVYLNLGMVYYKLGKNAAAQTAYRQGIENAPDDTQLHYGLAMTLEQNREVIAAKAEYHIAMKLDPTYEKPYERLAALHRELGEVTLAKNVEASARQYGL